MIVSLAAKLTRWVSLFFPDHPGAVHPRVSVAAPPASRLRGRLPSGSVRLEEEMSVFLPAAAPGHHDSKPGPHCLDHESHEFLSGEYRGVGGGGEGIVQNEPESIGKAKL